MRIASRRAAPCRLLALAVAALTPLSMADLWHARAAAGAPTANYAIVSDAAVVAGLRRLVTQATGVAAKTAAKDRTAKAAVAAMYDTWFTFEGTVRKKDQSLYLDMEDTLAGVKGGQERGDASKAARSAADLAALAKRYVTAHPATGAVPSPAPTTKVAGPMQVVGVRLNEWKIVVPKKIPRGNVRFVINNRGKEKHEFVVFRTDIAPGKLKLTAEGRIDEKGPGVTLVDEHENIKPGTTAELQVTLAAGRYVFSCNLPNHYKNGMIIPVTVA